jgi:hypothetical protein
MGDQTRQHQQLAPQHAHRARFIMLSFMQVALKLIGIWHQKMNFSRCVNGNVEWHGGLMQRGATVQVL